MEQFLQQVRAYAEALGVEPTTVVQRAGKVSGAAWKKWSARESSPTMAKADEILKYIADNPAPLPESLPEPLKAAG